MLGTIHKINYAGMSSVDFPTFTLITDCSMDDSDKGESPSYLNREPVSSERYDGSYNSTYRYKWSEKFEPKVTFLKDDFTDFTDTEVRSVLRWLTSKAIATYADFYDDINSDAILYSLLGNWTNIQLQKLSNARVIGITATFLSVTPYAMSGLQTITKTITTPQEFTINCDSDEQEGLIYPKIVITENGTIVDADHEMITITEHARGTVYKYANKYYWIDASGVLHYNEISTPLDWSTTGVIIKNTTLNNTTIVGNNNANSRITIDGANQVIGYEVAQINPANGDIIPNLFTSNNRVWGNDFSWNWLPLQRGDNVIKITGNCTVQITYRYPIKLGEW